MQEARIQFLVGEVRSHTHTLRSVAKKKKKVFIKKKKNSILDLLNQNLGIFNRFFRLFWYSKRLKLIGLNDL